MRTQVRKVNDKYRFDCNTQNESFYYHKESNEDGEVENEGEVGSGEATADDEDYYYYEDYTK